MPRWIPRDEIRVNPDQTLDEVVMFGCNVHLEQMDDHLWWMGLTKDGKTVHVWFESKSKKKLEARVNEDEIGLPVVSYPLEDEEEEEPHGREPDS